MPTIHPTAIVDPLAELAGDVEIGPHCIIRGRVRIGLGTRLIANVYLHGPLTIGEDNTFYPNTCIGLAPQDRKFDPDQDAPGSAGTVIGDGNTLREGVTIHRATAPAPGSAPTPGSASGGDGISGGGGPTTLGHNNYLMVNCHIGHDAVVGDHCTLANGVLLGGHVHLADQVMLGGNAVVHQFCRVGRLAIISGVEATTQDMPPFCASYHTRTVGSLNIIGLRRAGLRDHIPALKHAFRILYTSQHTNSTALRLIRNELHEDPLCQELADFVAASKRGISPYSGRRHFRDLQETNGNDEG